MSVIVVSTHREEVGVEVQESHEHEHQQYSTTQLHVLLRRALSHGGDSGKHALSFRTRLGQQQEQTTSEGKVSVRGERTVIFGQCPSDRQSVKQDNAWSRVHRVQSGFCEADFSCQIS